jgi:hypothetical protein
MERRNFLKALAALAGGLVFDQATGLMVPRKKVWAVGAKLEAQPDQTTVVLPAHPDPGQEIVIVDKSGRELIVDGAREQIRFPDEGQTFKTESFIRLEFKNLKWAIVGAA